MKVTGIKAQKHRPDRYSIYIDGQYTTSLSENQLLDSQLRVGDEINDSRLEELTATSDFGKALDRVYTFLSYRPRSRQEITVYLRRKQYDEDMAEAVLTRLESAGYVNDQQFAADWVESRQLLNPRSRRQLQAELASKGVSQDIIEQALSGLQDSEDVESAYRVVTEKRLLKRYDDRQKLMRYLSSKGYSYQTIQAVLERLESTTD